MRTFATSTIEDIQEILSHISSDPSGIRMSTDKDYRFEVKEIKDEDPSVDGFLIRCGFWRPDTNTNVMGEGFGRWNHVPRNSRYDAVVMTAWVAIDLVVRHESMEAFKFMDVKVLNPHKSVEELAYPKTL